MLLRFHARFAPHECGGTNSFKKLLQMVKKSFNIIIRKNFVTKNQFKHF